MARPTIALLLFLSLGWLACSQEESRSDDDDDGSGGAAVATGSGGDVASDASASSTADTSSSSGPSHEECVPHTGEPVFDVDSLEPCGFCGGGHCVPEGLVPAENHGDFAGCSEGLLCLPDNMIESGGDFVLPTCASRNGMEGRCVSTCLPLVAEQADMLPQATCGAAERCVPCYDPFDGTPTGACSLSCDEGPKGPSETLPTCCDGVGACVPSDLVPEENSEQLDADTCPQGNGPMLCVPTDYLDTPFVPEACETSWAADVFGELYRPGACVPSCLPATEGIFQNLILGQDGCPATHVCAPCLAPPSGDPSGACTVIGGSCQDACGEQSPDGCWCDAECIQYGDCCSDACDLCGSCVE